MDKNKYRCTEQLQSRSEDVVRTRCAVRKCLQEGEAWVPLTMRFQLPLNSVWISEDSVGQGREDL